VIAMPFDFNADHHRARWAVAVALLALSTSTQSIATPAEDASAVASLDIEYQAAVAKGDANAMARILADDFVLTTGTGKAFSKSDLLSEASSGSTVYERQEASSRTVHVWGDTAVVTALLWAKGAESGKPFEYRLWFSDTYVRSANGWRYVFGQASLPLPHAQ
jgi:ketosteroid isomerase-like protein